MTLLRTFCGLLLLMLAGALSPAQAQHAAMVQQIRHPQTPGIGNLRVATDAAGNSYYVGCWTKRCSVGNTQLVAAPGDTTINLYVMKFDALGRPQWAQQAASPGQDISYAMTVDPNGSGVYVSGTCGAHFRVGANAADTLSGAGNFLLKLNAATGTVAWLRQPGGPDVAPWNENVRISSLAANATGLYLSGTSLSTRSIDGLPIMDGRGARSGLVARLDHTTGQMLATWQCAASTYFPVALVGTNKLSVNSNGDVVVLGAFNGSVQFGADDTTHIVASHIARPGYVEGFMARVTLSPTGGTTQWVMPVPGPSSVVIDDQANTYLGGNADSMRYVGTALLPAPGMYFAGFDPQGGTRWAQTTTPGSFNTIADMAIGSDGLVYTLGYFSSAYLRFGPHTVTNGPTGGITAFLTSFDGSGAFRWARGSDAQVGVSDFPQSMGIDARNRLYVGALASYAVSQFDGLQAQPGSFFLMRFDPAVRIGGRVYFDQNANGVRDPGEPPFPRPVVVTDAQRAVAAASSPLNGAFSIFADTGRYDVSVPLPPANYRVVEGSTGYRGHLTAYGQADTARVFGIAEVAPRTDLRVTLTAYMPARVGRATYYRAQVENMGTLPTDTTVRLQVDFDAAGQYVGAFPLPAVQAGTRVGWVVPALAPFQKQDFDFAVNLPINVAVGTPLLTSAALLNLPSDTNPADNQDSLRQVVVASADPNDITVNYSRLTPQQVASGTTLDYVIRFQNVGTDTAFAVLIQDTLPAHLLQLGTLRLVAQSHNCEWTLDGQGRLRLTFPGIKLPHQAVNAIRSMGFVRFQVLPRATLAPGDLIPNQAHITFDFNSPLPTNEVTTLVQSPNGLVAEAAAATWSLYPNPTASAERVTLAATTATAGPATVRVFDALGRPVRTEAFAAPAGAVQHPLDLTGVAPGLYVVRLTLPDGTATARRLVVTP